MTEETENLVLEAVKDLRGEVAVIREDLHGIRVEMGALKDDIAAFVSQVRAKGSEHAEVH